jgi:hypothetical protein
MALGKMQVQTQLQTQLKERVAFTYGMYQGIFAGTLTAYLFMIGFVCIGITNRTSDTDLVMFVLPVCTGVVVGLCAHLRKLREM